MRWRHTTTEFLALFVLSLLMQAIGHAQITVSAAQTAATLAQKLAGAGVTIINPTLTCASQANGLFSVINSNLGLDSGIVLTTGRAATAGNNYGINGPSGALASTDDGQPGDIALDPLAGQPTIDACSLEFDILPHGDSIKFNYVFSSEEYENAVCGPYNDAFAFFIYGPGISGGDNMALVPGTNIPVTINTINDGIPGITGNLHNCTMMGPGSPFTAYYIDNAAGTTLTHRGFTQVLQAIHAVIPCNTYHLKIAIADAGDPLYDSGVFLQAGSLQTTSFNISAALIAIADTAEAFCVKGCLQGRFHVKRSQPSSQPQTIKFFTGGNAISGIDYSPLPDSVVIPAGNSTGDVVVNGLPTSLNGPKTIRLFILSPYSCSGTYNIVDSATLLIYDTLSLSMISPDTVICANDSVQLLVNGEDILSYTWSPGAGLSDPHIKGPVAFPSANTTYTVTASLPGTSCPAKTADIHFTVKLTPDVYAGADTSICFNSQLQLTASVTTPNLYYSYLWNGPNGFTSSIMEPKLTNATQNNTGVYTLYVTNDTNGCKGISSMSVVVIVPDTPAVVSPQIFCLNSPATALTATGKDLLWYTLTDSAGDTAAPVPQTGQVASYIYYVSQKTGNCESPKAAIDAEVKKCCDGTIFIPSAFSPNGDGFNDRFRAIEDYGYFIESMYVFNRWGQMVYSGLHGGWDGYSGGKPADLGTYFYFITFGCILGGEVERKGEVTLIR